MIPASFVFKKSQRVPTEVEIEIAAARARLAARQGAEPRRPPVAARLARAAAIALYRWSRVRRAPGLRTAQPC